MTSQMYMIEAIDAGPSRIRKPRQWLDFTVRRLEDGRVLHLKLRCVGQVGDTIALDDDLVQIGLWKS